MAFLKFDIIADGLTDTITRVLSAKATKAEHIVAQQVKKDTEPYVPALTESLNDRTKVDGNMIIYPGPYARYLYYGKLMVDPDTGSSWAKKGATKVLNDRNLVFNTSVHPQAQSHWFEASRAQNMDKWVKAAAKGMEKYGDK